jgi:putative endonuclease
MKMWNKQTGRRGEDMAAEYLLKLGYDIIMRNYSTRFGEIDLVCQDKDVTVFVEVKAKKGVAFGSPEEMFTRYKYGQVKRMGQVFLKGCEVPCRIDMVAVEFDAAGNTEPVVRHYKNVVY